MNVAETLLVLGLAWTVLGLLCLLATAIVVWRIVDRVYPTTQAAVDRPVPTPYSPLKRTRSRARQPLSTSAVDETTPPIEGVNRFGSVDESPIPAQIGDDSESALLEEREEAWRELRAEGLTDEEIAQMERASAIRVFD